MKNKTTISLALLIASTVTQTAYAGSTQHFSEAIGHSAQAVGHSVVGTVKLASSAIAVPLIIVGEIGEVSQAAGKELWDISNQPIGEPLPISTETVSVGPAPNIAIKQNDTDDEGEY